jgi:hypothetical protein
MNQSMDSHTAPSKQKQKWRELDLKPRLELKTDQLEARLVAELRTSVQAQNPTAKASFFLTLSLSHYFP